MLSEMDMEEAGMGMEVVVVSCKSDAGNNVAKGKRTKRRLKGLSPVTTAVMTSSSSSASGGGAGSLEEEEEDMANCLILLAQGRGEGGDPTPPTPSHKDPCGDDGVHVNTHKSSTTKLDLYAYECKTCNRTFPSFQALGGHRASHKKPKLEDKNSSSPPPPPPHPSSQLFHFEEQKQRETKIINPSVSLQLGCGNNQGNKSKVHQCSICGSEFTSGQALGGHMRRHRASSTHVAVDVKPRNVLELDLNLPAPEEDIRDSNFHFPANQNSMMLSAAPALVGCHY